VSKLDYIYISQQSQWEGIPTPKNDVIADLKTRYMPWRGIKYTMYSLQSKSDFIIFIPRRVKARLYLCFTIQFIWKECARETKRCYSRNQNALYAMARNKYPMYSFQSKSDWIIFIPRRVKARLYICSSQLNLIGTNPHAKRYDVIHELKTRYMLWPGI
jgi:hypothetical protein